MKTDIFMLFAASALVLFSCSKEKVQEPVQDAPMRFAVTVEGTTKASMTSADLNQFYLKVTGPVTAFSFFDSMVKEGESWKATYNRLLWKDEASSITYAAASYGALGADYFNYPVTDAIFTKGSNMPLWTDQRSQKSLNAADLLTMASTDLAFADTDKGVVPITLKHGLAKVNFSVNVGNAGEIEADDFELAIISGVHTVFNFKPLTGEVTIPLSASTGTVLPFASAYDNAASCATYEAVLAPETLPAGSLSLYLTIGGKDYCWKNSEDLVLEQGGEYTIPVTVE